MKNFVLAVVMFVAGSVSTVTYLSVIGRTHSQSQTQAQKSEHVYRVQVIDTPQMNGTVAHDYARVDMTDGTMCSLHEAFWLNGAFVDPCNGHKP